MKRNKDDEEKRVPEVVEALGEFVSEWRSLGNTVIMRPSVASFQVMMVRSPLSSLENPTRFECLVKTAAPLDSRSREAVSRQSCHLISSGRLLKKLGFQPLIEGAIDRSMLCEALNTDEELISRLKKARLESVSVAMYEGPLTEMSLSLSGDTQSESQRADEFPSVTWLITASKRIPRGIDFRGHVRATYQVLDLLSYKLQDMTQKAVFWKRE